MALQDVMNVLVRDCGPKFFCTALPGCLLLTFDFIKAAGRIISAVDCKEVNYCPLLVKIFIFFLNELLTIKIV